MKDVATLVASLGRIERRFTTLKEAVVFLKAEGMLVASTKDAISLAQVTSLRVVTSGAYINRGFIAAVDGGYAVGWK